MDGLVVFALLRYVDRSVGMYTDFLPFFGKNTSVHLTAPVARGIITVMYCMLPYDT